MRNNDKGEDFSEILPFVEVIRLGLWSKAGDMRWNGERGWGGGAWGNIWMGIFA